MTRKGGGPRFWPHTRIRKRGMAASQSLKMRSFVKGTAIYLSIFFAFSLGYVWTRVQVVEAGYRLRNLEVQKDQLKEENRSLMVEAATLRSPQRLGQLAMQMGLKQPTENQIIYLKKDRVSGSGSPAVANDEIARNQMGGLGGEQYLPPLQ